MVTRGRCTPARFVPKASPRAGDTERWIGADDERRAAGLCSVSGSVQREDCVDAGRAIALLSGEDVYMWYGMVCGHVGGWCSASLWDSPDAPTSKGRGWFRGTKHRIAPAGSAPGHFTLPSVLFIYVIYPVATHLW